MLYWTRRGNGTVFVKPVGEIGELSEVVFVEKTKRERGWRKLGQGRIRIANTMIGLHPVIQAGSYVGYLFPGEMTDALDGAPIISQSDSVLPKPKLEFWDWVVSFGVLRFYLATIKAEQMIKMAKAKKIMHADWWNSNLFKEVS